jgi:NTP pyrophosphatase (non-canonical NTP hydrolase)
MRCLTSLVVTVGSAILTISQLDHVAATQGVTIIYVLDTEQRKRLMNVLELHLKEVVNKSWNFAKRIKTKQGHEQNALVGLASEAGELLDVGKKMWFHQPKPKAHSREKLLSELGDVIFYWLKALDVFGFTIDEVVAYNRKKLESRHPELGKVKERFGKDAIRG